MFSATWDPARRLRGGLALLIPIGLLLIPATARAQGDTTRVTYRTREVVFLGAGRDDGLAVGDTVDLVQDDGGMLTRAVVISTARHTASARLLDADAAVRERQLVRFTPHPPAPVAELPDTTGPPLDTVAYADTMPYVPVAAPQRPRRLRGGVQLEQYAQASGADPNLHTQQTALALDLDAPLADGVTLRLRETNRWRAGASRALTGQDAFTAVLYRAELEVAPSGASWSATVGRFVPRVAMGLGYLDGARLEVRFSPAHRLGAIGGFVPEVVRLRPSTETKRVGAYWAFGTGATLDGSLSAAADWRAGGRQRTEVAGQVYWRPLQALGISTYGEVDLPVTGGLVSATQLTTFGASLNATLPLALRGTIGVSANKPVPVVDPALPPDTNPLPGSLRAVNVSLGRTFGRLTLDLGGGALHREGDATNTLRGSLTASVGPWFLTALVQHGDLLDYKSLLLRVIVPTGTLPITFAVGANAALTQTAAGQLSFWRYAIRPELSWRLGNGFLATAGGDVGTYDGQSSTWLHAGVSYRFY
jgi:hypothetical protein